MKVVLKPKMYSILYDDKSHDYRAKEIQRHTSITHQLYKECLFQSKTHHTTTNQINSCRHQLYSIRQNKHDKNTKNNGFGVMYKTIKNRQNTDKTIATPPPLFLM